MSQQNNNTKVSQEDFKKFWEELEAGADIVDIIGSYISLKKEGKDFKAKCPFHDEKSASFSIDRNKQIYKCFGCDAHGTALTFIMKYENIDWYKAVKTLADKMGRSMPDGSAPAKADYRVKDAEPEELDDTWFFDYGDFTDKELESIFATKTIEYVKAKVEQEKANKGKDVKPWNVRLVDICKKYGFYKLNSFSIVKNRKVTNLASNDDFPIFVWEMKGDRKKVYQPKSEDKGRRFMYYDPNKGKSTQAIGEYLFGITQAQKRFEELNADKGSDEFEEDGEPVEKPQVKLPEIILASGGSDALNLVAMDYYPVWMNSETAKLDGKTYASLAKIAEKVMILPDIDSTGIQAAHSLCMIYLEMHTICLPDSLLTKRDSRGYKCKDFRDYMRHFTAKQFADLVKAALPYKFWAQVPEFDKKGKLKGYSYQPIVTHLYWFLKQNGFYILNKKNETEIYIKITGNIVKEVKAEAIRKFVNDFLKAKNEDVKLRDVFYKTAQLNANSFNNLDDIKIDFTDFTKTSQYLFFTNGTWEVKANEIKAFKPGVIKKYVWDKNVINHEVKQMEDMFTITYDADKMKYSIVLHNTDSIFVKYLIRTCTMHWKKQEDYFKNHQNLDGFKYTEAEEYEHQLHIINRICALGYLLHRYKEPSSAFIVWAMENEVVKDGNSEGRSGKSIFMKAPKYLMDSQVLGARDQGFFDNKHWNENITEFTKYVLFDDANEFFKTDLLFPMVTGGITINAKNVKSTTIEEEDSPKYGVSSNFSPKKIDGSTLDRLWFTVFSDYYHGSGSLYTERRTPKTDFGINLFTEFDENQWNLFLNFAALCIKAWLTFGKVDPPMANVRQRQLLGKMGDSFKNWADVYFSKDSARLDVRVNKIEAFDSCRKETNNNKLSAQGFKGHLKTFCEYYGYTFNPASECTTEDKIIVNDNGKTTEMIYLSTKTKTIPTPNPTPTPPSAESEGEVTDDLPF